MAFRGVAKEFKGKLMFVTANNEDKAAEPITNYFALKEAASPTVSTEAWKAAWTFGT